VIYDRQLFNAVVNVTFSMALAKIIVSLFDWIYRLLANIPFIKYFSDPPKYYIIKTTNPYYDKIIELLYKKYINQVHGGFLFIKDGNQKTMIEELTTKELSDTFQYENKNYNMTINLTAQNSIEEPTDTTK